MTEYWTINGHRQDCAYIRSLGFLDEEEPCDCEPDDDEEDTFWDEDGYYVDGDYGW